MQIRYPAIKIARKKGGPDVKDARERRLPYPSSEKSDLSHLLAENPHVITERQLAEALQIEKNKLQSVIDAMTDTLTILNHDFNIIFQNKQSRVSSGEHIGEKCYHVYENRDMVCEGCPVAMAFQDGRSHTSERKNLLPSGEVSFWENTANPVRDASGKVIICCEIGHEVTERKKAEKALQESQQFAASLLENAPHATVVLNPDTSVRYVNPAWERLNGWTLAEAVGLKAPYPWWPENQREEMLPYFLEAIRQPVGKGEIIALKKNGEPYWIDMNWVSVTQDGESQYVIINSVDITERKKAEEKRQAILKTALDGFCITDLEGKFLEVNDSFCAMSGYTQEELLKMAVEDIGPPEGFEEMERHFSKIVENGSDRFETHGKRKDGNIIDIEISARYPDTGEKQVFVFVRDITGRKKVEEQLRLLSSVTQQVSDSIMITDPRFKITYMNQAAQDLFGYTINEIRGKNLATFHIVPPSEKTNRAVRETLNQGKVWCQTIPKKRKDGSTIICDCRLSPLHDEAGQICAYIDVQRDVTAQKDVEAKLQAQKQLIESILENMLEGVLVVDATDRVILANESALRIFHRRHNTLKNKLLKDIIPVAPLLNLYHRVKLGKKEDNTLEFMYRVNDIDKIVACGAVKMDEERTLLTFTDISREREEKEKLYLTDRLASIGEMAVGLAHELNNPLTGILSLSQLLIDSNIPPETREDLQCINSEAKRAAIIVKNVLLFTRNNNYENGQASVNEVVRDVLRLREYEEKASKIKVATNLQENLPYVQIDQFQLQQVFLNIILNAEAAIKDANRPGILNINTAKVNSHVDIAISDNGCGIKKNVLPRIFDPFFTTKEIGKGTGLGLSICYGIVSKHGGKISVSTRVNQGTTFTVRMPAALEQNT